MSTWESASRRTRRRRRRGVPSPDLDALGFVEPEGVGVGDAERVVEGGDVADDLVAAELGRRVRVCGQALQEHLGTGLRLPDRCPGRQCSTPVLQTGNSQ